MRADVLAAVNALLTEDGYDALSIEAVADRSGVHRTTVYRRWGSVPMLLVDLLDLGAEDDWRAPDTGSLEGDLIAVNREVRDALSADPSPTLAVIAASFRSPEAAQALRRFWADRYERCAVAVQRAVDRGEVPAGTDPDRLLIAATGPLYHHRVLLGRALTRDEADAYARAALAGAAGA
ncbi:TetR family transcriptional regulator [Actinorugispora endophytica]|uniref:TetR family transcriptional regulator n=1 Tax=Actinorugispora endophytica TaxID=1605990 RepID=A0A4R6UYV2_9ACTN|nr:TetR family transcriptional regulator [Actinorugispora endophytica]